jgi:Histidine kinase-, DNA gyrase B-, and HSP90-like ATPase
MPEISLELGLDVIRSYKRLSYTPWHAIAEFVDNSTQSYFNNRDVLDAAYAGDDETLEVAITYDRQDPGVLRVVDNAMGMSLPELGHALHIGAPPSNVSGRSQFGLGMKTAACWIGNLWTVRTKRLGETVEYEVTIDVERVAAGENTLTVSEHPDRDPEDHFTVIEITNHNHKFQGRTLGKIRQYLASMYRQDLRKKQLQLLWQGEVLEWVESDEQFVMSKDGRRYKKKFGFKVGGKDVRGWVGVLEKGSRAKAGFSILRGDRVIRGWPDSWRPEVLYGQVQGSNDLVNQRLLGEIHLDGFEVSHTKDDILWMGDEEEKVERGLKKYCGDYREFAKLRRKGDEDERGPSELEIQTAVDELLREIGSPDFTDVVLVDAVPPPDAVSEAVKVLFEAVDPAQPTFWGLVGGFKILGYLADDLSGNDPYVAVDSTHDERVAIVVNMKHPHFSQLKGADGVLNFLRHCTYDGVAEWQARHKAGNLDPDTIKVLKDRLLRVPFEMEMHDEGVEEEVALESGV